MSSLVWPCTCLHPFLNTFQKVRTFLGTEQFTVLCFPTGNSHSKTKLERGQLTYFNILTRLSTGSLERYRPLEALSYERGGYDRRKTEIEPERRPVWTWLGLYLTPWGQTSTQPRLIAFVSFYKELFTRETPSDTLKICKNVDPPP